MTTPSEAIQTNQLAGTCLKRTRHGDPPSFLQLPSCLSLYFVPSIHRSRELKLALQEENDASPSFSTPARTVMNPFRQNQPPKPATTAAYADGGKRVTAWRQRTPHDGACLFTSLAHAIVLLALEIKDQPQKSDEWGHSLKDAAALRKLVCATLREGPRNLVCSERPQLGTHLDHVLGDSFPNCGQPPNSVIVPLPGGGLANPKTAAFNSYVDGMSKSFTWGGSLEIWVVAVLFNTRVMVYEDVPCVADTYRLLEPINSSAVANTICLRYVGGLQGGVHYEYLMNVSEVPCVISTKGNVLRMPTGSTPNPLDSDRVKIEPVTAEGKAKRKEAQHMLLQRARGKCSFDHPSYASFVEVAGTGNISLEDHLSIEQTGTPFTGACGWWGTCQALMIKDVRTLVEDIKNAAEVSVESDDAAEKVVETCKQALLGFETQNTTIPRPSWLSECALEYVSKAYPDCKNGPYVAILCSWRIHGIRAA